LKAPIAGSTKQDGYSMLASNIPTFQVMNQMPLIIDPSRLDEGQGIETTLQERGAKYHQSFHLVFNNTKLKRANKRVSTSTETTETVIQSKIRKTSLEPQKCFLYNKVGTKKNKLRKAMTMKLDKHVKLIR
jgi:hypothetical protein